LANTHQPPGRGTGSSSRPGMRARLGGAILFYTRLPLPPWWSPRFEGIAALAPTVGLLLGGLLALIHGVLHWLGLPAFTAGGLVVGAWVWLTGGLHLDGAMDTADGLAVVDPQRRLAVMADSRTGAFGVMTALAIVGLKTTALAEMAAGQGWVLVVAALWGRWGQLLAIARYPYLKAQGKGALHRQHLRLPQDLGLGSVPLVLVYGLWLGLMALGYQPEQLPLVGGSMIGGLILAVGAGAWLNRRLGGQTGDTYGAVVEWTETLVLCLATAL
jgi:adenosylcobinamide-GDP ribazoletransferase